MELLGVVLDVERNTEMGLEVLEKREYLRLAEVSGETFSPQIGREGQGRILKEDKGFWAGDGWLG